jgi:hypothetical protein
VCVQGATLVPIDSELVLYGGDQSGASSCTQVATSGEWRWTSIIPAGAAPVDRQAHAAAAIGSSMVVFGGAALSDGTELSDLFWLRKLPNGGWAWGCPNSQAPCIRCGAAAQSLSLSLAQQHHSLPLLTPLLMFSLQACCAQR